MIKINFIYIIGKIIDLFMSAYIQYQQNQIIKHIQFCGTNSQIAYPFQIRGRENIVLGNDVSIGLNATLFCTRAKIVFHDKSFSGPNLTIITGDHPYIIGEYMYDLR